MKWNQLPDQAKLVLREDLMFLPQHAMQDGMVYSRSEVVAMLEVAYPAGTTFTFDLEEEVLYDKGEGICARVPALDTEMDDMFAVQ